MFPPIAEVAGSPALRAAFVALTMFVGLLFVAAVYWSSVRAGVARAAVAGACAAVWIALTGVAAARGALHFDRPPTMLLAIGASLALSIGLALSPLGKRVALGLPVFALVGYQGFRILVELVLHRAYTEGLMPVQMSYAGRNFDIVTGVTALALAAWLATGHWSRPLVAAWNTLGVALLANILIVALLSAPTPFRVFMNEPANIWITHAPWVWLPTVMVFAAVFGHVAVYRRLLGDSAARAVAS